jgi:hypothetical protein
MNYSMLSLKMVRIVVLALMVAFFTPSCICAENTNIRLFQSGQNEKPSVSEFERQRELERKQALERIKNTLMSHFARIADPVPVSATSAVVNQIPVHLNSSTTASTHTTRTNETMQEKLERLEQETAKLRQELAEVRQTQNEGIVPSGLISLVSYKIADESFRQGRGQGKYDGWVVCDGNNQAPNLTARFIANESTNLPVYIIYNGKPGILIERNYLELLKCRLIWFGFISSQQERSSENKHCEG